MKINPWSFGILFMLIIIVLMINDFKTPTFFFSEETQKSKAKIIETDWGHGIKGRPLKTFTYQFKVNDKLYEGKHKGSSSYKHLKVGNNLLV